MRLRLAISGILACVTLGMLAACTTGAGAKWYAPATWFSHAPAAAVDAAQKRRTAAEGAAIKAAQKATHETAAALASAPASRPVAVAVASNDTAVQLLDQVAGPLTVAEAAALRQRVADLLSENAAIRAAAEAARASDAETVAGISQKLAAAQAATDRAEGNLRTAFERENALANELRGQRALFWIAVSVSALLAAGWFYVRFMCGGLPMAAGKFMRDLRKSHPAAARVAEPLFDSYLNRHEQAQIRRHAVR